MEIEKEDIQNLRASITQLTAKMDDLSASILGRSGKKSQVPGSKSGQTQAQQDANKLQKQSNDQVKLGLHTIKRENLARKDNTSAIDDETKARQKELDALEKAAESQKQVRYSLKSFGKNLFADGNNLASTFDTLGSNLKYAGTSTTKLLGGIAGGIGFALGGLTKFAESAADFGAFADLSRFSAGSVRSMKVMSGLGNSFTKVIEESQGRFRAFGDTSQQAAENLSNLSRGLKYGSGYLNSTLKKSLGTELVKSVDAASDAAAAMGLSDDERAKLFGQTAQIASLAAKNQQEAQQRLVKQFSDTVISSIKLSDTFGVSAKVILESIAEFRKTAAGQFAGLEGNVGAENLTQVIKSMGIASDPETVSKIALALSRGQLGEAQYALGPDKGSQQQILQMLARATEGSDGGARVDVLNANLKNMAGEMSAYSKDLSRYQATNAEYAAPGAALGVFAKNLELGKPFGEEGKPPETSEMKNIKALNSLQAATESLRNVMIAATAAMLAIAGPLGTIALSGLGGGVLAAGGLGKFKDGITALATSAFGTLSSAFTSSASKFKDLFTVAIYGTSTVFQKVFSGDLVGKFKDAFGTAITATSGMFQKVFNGSKGILSKIKDSFLSFRSANQGPQLPGTGGIFSRAGGFFKSIFGSSDETAKVESTSKSLGATLKELGKGIKSLVSSIGRGLGSALSSLSEVFSKVLSSIGSGLGKGIQAVLSGLASGIMAFANPTILLGAAILSGTIALLGAGTAAALALIGLSLKPFAEGLQELDKVSGDNFLKIGAGLAAIGVGLVAFVAGNTVGQLAGISSSILSFFGAKSPMERIKEFVPMADKIGILGTGIKNFGEGIAAINSNIATLDAKKFAEFKDIMVELSKVNIPALSGLNVPGLQTNVLNGIPPGGNIETLLGNQSAITPELINQVLSYLSNIENDLQAIRGNTKGSPYDAPVRLS